MTPEPASAPATPVYRERLRTPWWWYLAALGVAVLLGAEFALAVPRWWAWVILAVLVALSTGAVWRMSEGEIVIGADSIRLGERTVPTARVEAAIRLSGDELRRLVGRHGDPSAYVYIRSWIGPGLQLVLRPVNTEANVPTGADDVEEWVPYCVVSSRHPLKVTDALAAVAVPIR